MSGSASLTKRPAKSVIRSSKVPSGAHRVLERDPVLLAEPEVVLAEGDRGVHQAGALVGGDEVGLEDRVAARPVVGDVVEGRLVRGPGQRAARKAVEHLGALAEHALDERPRRRTQHLVRARRPHPRVLDLRADGDRGVRDQRPRRRRPDEQLVAGLQRRLRGRRTGSLT